MRLTKPGPRLLIAVRGRCVVSSHSSVLEGDPFPPRVCAGGRPSVRSVRCMSPEVAALFPPLLGSSQQVAVSVERSQSWPLSR